MGGTISGQMILARKQAKHQPERANQLQDTRSLQAMWLTEHWAQIEWWLSEVVILLNVRWTTRK